MKKYSLIMLALLLGCAVQAQEDKGFEIAKNLEIFANVYKNINTNYVDDVDPGKTMKVAIDAMLASLDPYTNYYPESDIEDVKLQMLGQYGGIGALVHQQDSFVYIAEPYEGLPADEAGLRAGDRILEVNGESTKGKNYNEVSSAMRGQAGTTLALKVDRDGKILEKTITRREIKLPNVSYSGMVAGNVGYIKLDEFTQDAAKNVRSAFRQLKQDNPDMAGVILDLRGNGGGLMNEAVDIVNIFVKPGEVVVETKGKVASKNMKSMTRTTPEDVKIPVAVLIDGYSASASEIVSGSLQDFDRAVIIGSRSFGKGLVQNILPMPYNNQMKVTISKYFIPSGRCIQALDYQHRDEYGRATKVPDSLKTAFKTRNGRTVYDGFGIEPDIEVEPEYMSTLAIALNNKFHVFNYACKFVKEHPSIPTPDKFEITDEIYNDFLAYMSDKSYEYTTYTEKLMQELRRVAKEENYMDAMQQNLDSLEARFKADKEADLKKNRKEISQMIQSELLARYYYQKGRIQGMLRQDPEVQCAVKVLNDKQEYNRLLTQGK